MKSETVVLIIVGVATTLSAMSVTLTTSLAQWANSPESPTRITWVIIIAGCLGQGMNHLVAFLSQRFASWVTGHKTGDSSPTENQTPKG